MSDFVPGLEGVVAFETGIAEPDKDGGSLRYRAQRFRDIIADGTGLLALSYRGFGGSSGKPTATARPMPTSTR